MEIFKRIAKSLFGPSRSSKSKPVKRPMRKSSPKIKKTSKKTKAPSKAKKKQVKKAVKKSLKSKKTVSKKTVKKSKKISKKPAKKQPAMVKEALALLPVGEVTHYFPHVQAAVVKILQGAVRQGDVLSFRGHTTNFRQGADSMQIDNKPVLIATKGDEIGIRVKSRVRAGDQVFKV